MRYETRYVIVAGLAWIRRTFLETRDGHRESSDWLILFDGESPPRKRDSDPGGRLDEEGAVGELDGVGWELRFEALAPPFRSPHPLLRGVSSSQLETWPALAISGRIGARPFERAHGHYAHLWGRRHAKTWGWAHASLADGSWVHLLTTTLPGLPRLSQVGRSGRPPGLPFARGSVDPPAIHVGAYEASADPSTFVRLRYTDTDGSGIWCYHSESARVRGPALNVEGAALEIALREELPGWPISH